MTPRNRTLLAKVTVPATLRGLLALPETLLAEARAGSGFRAQVAAQRALLLEILCKCPMRLGNLLDLRLDKHVLRPDPKSHRITMIMIPDKETKNEQELMLPISETTATRLDIWIRHFRPFSAAVGNPYLFPGKGLGPMTRAGLRDTLKAITDERLGIAINPHAFRHLAGYIFLKEYPGHYEEVRKLLGHKSITTTVRSYCGLEGESAAVRFDKIIEDQRQTLGFGAPKRKPATKSRKTTGGRR
jgi:integrase